MKRLLLLLLPALSLTAQAQVFRFDFGSGEAAEGYVPVTAGTLYSEAAGYGFEPGAAVTDVVRKKGDRDKRQQIVSLTEKGKQMETEAYQTIPQGMGEELKTCPLQLEDFQNLAKELDSIIETLKKK